MKSTIKSAFAIIAVALMVMVAIVPMANVFSDREDVAAAAGDADYTEIYTDLEAINIAGTVYKANGTTTVDGTVTIDADGKKFTASTTAGAYTKNIQVPVGTVVKKITINVNIATGANKGMTFPEVVLQNVTADQAGVNVVATSVPVTGQLTLKDDDTAVALKDITINGGEGTVKTDNTGSFTFQAQVGKTYTLTATAVGGTQFKAKDGAITGTTVTDGAFVAGTSDITGLKIGATSPILTGTTNIPYVASYELVPVDNTKTNSVSAISAPEFGYAMTNSTNYTYTYYSKITYATTPGTTYTTSNVKFSFGYGLADLTAAFALGNATVPEGGLTADAKAKNIAAVDLKAGSVVIDGTDKIQVLPTQVVLTGTHTVETVTTTYTINAFIYEPTKQAFVGKNYSTEIALTITSIVPTYGGYEFTGPGTSLAQGTPIVSSNHVKVTFKVNAVPYDATSVPATITGTDAVYTFDAGEIPADTNRDVFIPKGNSISIKVGDTYYPNQYDNESVSANVTVPTFTLDNFVTYTGQITLNGVAVDTTGMLFAVSIDGGKSFFELGAAAILDGRVSAVTLGTTGYSFKVQDVVDEKDILVKVRETYVAGYKFTEVKKSPKGVEDDYYEFNAITSGKVADIPVKTESRYFAVKAANGTPYALSDVPVKFVMCTGDAYGVKKVKYTSEEVKTDAFGVATVKIAMPKDDSYSIWAVPQECDFTFGAPAYATGASSAVAATAAIEKITFGYVTMKDTGAIVEDPEVSFIASNGGVKISGEAYVEDNMYYIIAPATYDIDVYVDGLTFNDAYFVHIAAAAAGAQVDLTNAEVGIIIIPPVEYDVTPVGEYASFINVSVDEAAEGDVVTVSAPSSFVRANDETTYTDAYVKYTFVAWYVNGKEISKDCNTSFVMTDSDAAVSCDYAVEYVKTSDVNDVETPAAPENGVDTNVLIIGICAVVIALIAVVYAVIKRN